MRDFPELDLIVKSRNVLIDMHFSGPDSKKFVPLHCMEELIAGN
jgi:hypothetical protein